MENYNSDLICKKENIFFINDDFIKHEYEGFDLNKDTSLIFINCKTFTKNLMEEIAKKYTNISEGAYLITSFQNMEDYDYKWKTVDVLRKVMSWGPATIYINYKNK